MDLLHDHIHTGGLSEIYYAKAYWLRRAGIPGLGTWFTSKEQAGGGPLIDLGVHAISLSDDTPGFGLVMFGAIREHGLHVTERVTALAVAG